MPCRSRCIACRTATTPRRSGFNATYSSTCWCSARASGPRCRSSFTSRCADAIQLIDGMYECMGLTQRRNKDQERTAVDVDGSIQHPGTVRHAGAVQGDRHHRQGAMAVRMAVVLERHLGLDRAVAVESDANERERAAGLASAVARGRGVPAHDRTQRVVASDPTHQCHQACSLGLVARDSKYAESEALRFRQRLQHTNS
mgnify:CR=1 FL=1